LLSSKLYFLFSHFTLMVSSDFGANLSKTDI
jgi:hypothetical protein